LGKRENLKVDQAGVQLVEV